MHYRSLGKSGLKVSPLSLGTMMFGGATDETESRRIIDQARDLGVNFIDTADVYNAGISEEITGRAIAADRANWVLASKVGSPRSWSHAANQGLSRKSIFDALEGSLRRLGTDYLDLYYLHREDHDTPLEETISAIGDLIRQGRIRYWGVSNFRGWRLAEAVNIARRLGVDDPVASQPLYNIVNRQAETEQFTAARYYGLGVVPYSPLARGVLSGKYQPGSEPDAGSRAARQDKRILETEWRQESLALAQQVTAHAQRRGSDPISFAIAWVLANPQVSAAIVGPRTLQQWQSYVGALELRLDGEDEAFIDSLVTPGHASTHGFNDPAHFVSGRH
ncbi:NADP-dependent oxidoreductase [Pseudomonas daroniae]|uniref:NADP-dependent oxidoreductase n=1 Tax=Phytopseudomonas daroniae TaxID=2487519 RepID=A0A4Q9QHU4_9GAMM|nr:MULTISPECIES: aldo/keto reductase [Pseudomonas]TBU74884.1 NADP-dependent oxidoreductase [Pseudomonas daroniae]TBU79999.1 NADP-dependent oxidoreductase [Pseudomonas sp. FRB 228]TBU88978.1 NADP-dependent oxidoreductase [Pseudomonas daroniae]